MSPTSSRAAIRFVVALFLAQTFVNAVAVPHPHIHKVLDPRQVVSLPFVERQEPAEPESKNVFDAIIDTLRGYNGWQVFQDFFRKLFSGNPPAENNGDNDNAPSVSVSLAPVPVASESSIDVSSVIESIISEIASATEPIVVIPTPTDAETSTTDGIMSILPIDPHTTAIDFSGALETIVPTEFLSELPETTAAPVATGPIIVVVPDTNSTDVVVVVPTDVVAPIGTAPIVTGPVEVAPIATDAPFPIENGTIVAPIPGTDVPVVIVLPTGVLPTDISAPVEANVSVSASAVINATVSLTSTVGVTITAVAPIGTDLPSVGTGLPITISEDGAPFANATAITPTLVLVTGTGDVVGTIAPTLAVDPISAPFANSSDAATAVAPIGTAPVVIIGTGVISGTGVVSVEPVETIILSTGIVGTGEATAVAPIDTAVPFPNTTVVEVVVEPTFVLPSGTAPVIGTISAAPIASDASDAIYANTTTTTITNIITPSVVLGTGIETAVAPIGTGLPGTIVVVPGPGSTDDAYFPNITITVNATADATLSVELPVFTELPVEATAVPELPLNITLAPIAPVETEFPASPIETVTAIGPIIDEPIPSDAPVVEFPGEPTPVPLPSPIGEPVLDVPPIPLPSPIDVTFPSVEPVEEPTTTIVIPVPALTLDASPVVEESASASAEVTIAPLLPVIPIPTVEASPVEATLVPIVPVVAPVEVSASAEASVAASAAAEATILPVVNVAPAAETPTLAVPVVAVPSVEAPATTLAVVPVVPVAPAAPTLAPAASTLR